MRLEKFEISNYKNLKDFNVEFNNMSNISVLVGRNGSGKSNFLEALSLVFSNIFDIGSILDRIIENEYKANDINNLEMIPFNYKLQFTNKSKRISIEHLLDNPQNKLVLQGDQVSSFNIKINDEISSFKELITYIPSSIFGYYSGETSRLSKYFKISQHAYRKSLKENVIDTEFPRLFFVNEKVLEYIIFVNKIFSLKNNIMNSYVNETVNKVTSFRLTFNSPNSSNVDKYHSLDDRLSDFLKILTKAGDYRLGAKGQISSIRFDENIHFYNLLEALNDSYISERIMFENIINLYFSGIIKKVNMSIKTVNIHDIQDLSEGEKQLLTILGLLQIQKDNNCLFLFDEPDAFLYPKWQRKLANLLVEVGVDGQLILSTHSPITLGEIHKDSILVFHEGAVSASPINTYGNRNDFILEVLMGVSPRSNKFEPIISQFYEAVARKDINKSEKLLCKIHDLNLPTDDIFFSKADAAIRRLKIINEKNR